MIGFSIWNAIWLVIVTTLFIGALMLLFTIVTDLVRDHETSGGKKALWFIGLILFPLLGGLLYIAVRGDGMAKRQVAAQQEAQSQVDEYIRSVSGSGGGGVASELEKASSMHASGVLSDDEYAALKAKILA